MNEAELSVIRTGGGVQKSTHDAVPWAAVFRNSGIIILSLIIICSSFNSYFYFTWFPKYLESAHEVENQKSGLLTSLALLGSAFGVLGGGVIADRIRRKARSPVRARRIFCGSAFALAAIFLYFAVQCDSVEMLASLAALSCLSVQLTLPTWWSAAIEQSGRHVGPLFGLMNMMGTLGALASQGFVGVFADWQEARGLTGRAQWDPMFQVYIVILCLGAIGWAIYRLRPIEPESEEPVRA